MAEYITLYTIHYVRQSHYSYSLLQSITMHAGYAAHVTIYVRARLQVSDSPIDMFVRNREGQLRDMKYILKSSMYRYIGNMTTCMHIELGFVADHWLIDCRNSQLHDSYTIQLYTCIYSYSPRQFPSVLSILYIHRRFLCMETFNCFHARVHLSSSYITSFGTIKSRYVHHAVGTGRLPAVPARGNIQQIH